MIKVNYIDQEIRNINFRFYEVIYVYKFLMIIIKRKER